MIQEALKEVAGNARMKGSVLLLNTEFMSREDLESMPRVAERLLEMDGVSTAVVYGVSGNALYVFAKSKNSGASIEKLLNRAFSHVGQVKATNDVALAKVPLGLMGLLKNTSAILRTLEDAMCDALLGGAESAKNPFCEQAHSITRLKEIKSLVQGRERKAVAW